MPRTTHVVCISLLVLSRGDYFSATDTYDPLPNRRAFYDTSHLLPPAMLESYVEEWPTKTSATCFAAA
ncbi:MAG TPA: hypothetical protein VFE61_32795 [Candidatus Sulfotelmatobacter sp.]|jgi:hypothetical protein|nr:hypothetical protein [Candidatus Sulfotelmatobacter sp.]